tara:strand:+ start:61 stop:837 length:777 start_codon:yes stop_codon:yes gene_type:complete
MSSYLVGQLSDPNVDVLQPHFDKFVDLNSNFYWDLQTDKLYANDAELDDIDQIFLRHNVFEEQTKHKYENYYLLKNYIEYHEEIKFYNRYHNRDVPFKLSNLKHAIDLGLNVPYTEAGSVAKQEFDTIIKPVTGGELTKLGREEEKTTTFQQYIKGINKRVYVINDKHFAFELITDQLDYRDNEDCMSFYSDIPEEELEKLKKLMEVVNLNFTAADFMVDENNKHWFLEVNSLPMFVGFDYDVNGELSSTIRNELDNL